MITRKDIIAMARHITKRGNDIPDRKIMHPYREWYLGLGLFLLIALIGALYNALTFRHYAAIEGRVTASASDLVEYRDDAVRRVLEAYAVRAEQFEAALGSAPTSVRTVETEDESTVPAGSNPRIE